ncbi:MAG: FAD-dependent oxidoreductase [Deltaproteobacteria bacterium]|nr:FAD-dependent oxidoreductase [Deltaproteobacteria bacterium]
MKIVMIGGGGASIVCANTLRLLGSQAQIDLYTRREQTAYTPCEQPFFLRDAVPYEDMFYASPEWFAAKQIGLHTKRTVERIDREKKIIIADGVEAPYDILVINTGAKNKMPGIPGLTGERVYSLVTDIQSARDIEAILQRSRHAVIMGGGIIGIEMAETLVRKGYASVSMLVSSGGLLSRQLDPDMAGVLEPVLKREGVCLYLNDTAASVVSDGRGIRLALASGGSIDADWILVAKGIVPDVELAREAGLKIGSTGGIKVNQYLQTSDPAIYAAGDCIEERHMLSGKKFINALATNSNRTGRLIARNIYFGNRVPFLGSLYTFGAELFGKTVISVGLTERTAREEGLEVISVKTSGPTRKKIFDGRDIRIKLLADPEKQTLVGAQLIGPREASRIGERIILMLGEQIPVARISQYETIYSPPLSMAYDLITNAADLLISKLLKMGQAVRW